ncbi:MAG TPA: hybrid sensor histidine kinase/response regulator [Albitalea sp.]|uniref:hybrid sensor histidine kinase/response regulator n=1 Tax=Piscinibacter sp. TaxID=1903157 RepID=UPI002ED4BCD9
MLDTAAGPARLGGSAPRAYYVAVSGPIAGGAYDENLPQRSERRAIDRRLRDEALRAAMAAVPLVLASLAVAIACGLTALDASPWRTAWLAAALTACAAWGSMPWWHARRNGRQRGTRWRQRGFILLGMLAMGVVALLPWLGGRASEDGLLLLALGTVALCGAAGFAALPAPAALAALLPLSAVLADAVQGQGLPVDAAFAALLSAAAMGVGIACRRSWLRAARAALAREDRIVELEAARDAALRADQEKSRFLAIASHDLRQPVHALGLFAATLEKRLQGSDEEPLVRNVVRSIDGLDRSFNAMLDVSRLDAGTIEPNFQHFPLRDLFRRLHMHFAGQAEQAGLNLRFSPGGKSVTSDPQLLERIVGNLIQNAIKYTERGGIVVVARTTATHFNVEVWDTGVGIRAADLPRIFDEFYQVGRGDRTRPQGLGMGLAIVKRLVRLLGHTLTVASQPGRGTVFRVGIAQGGLPEIQDVTAAADTLPMPVLQARTVLIVDDEESIREGLGMLLEEWGYQAIAAGSVEQAERLVHMLGAPPDLILSDLHLGDGPDGIAAIEAVRRRCACDVPAILITGDTSHDEMRRATDSGHPVLFKPVQPRKLLNALRGLVS